MFPQSLLHVFIRQGTGQLSQYALGSRKHSELQLVIPMIRELKENDLLLADDLSNTYYHFHLIRSQKAHIIVPGKRQRNYTPVKSISPYDEIVEIHKTNKPEYVGKEEWSQLSPRIRLRRIRYTCPTKEGDRQGILYTTLLDEQISAIDIVLQYALRWEIEISIREIKTLMDINVLRSKTAEMLEKELSISLAAYNMVRKIIARSADKADFSPQGDIFQKCPEISRPILLDKKGRVFRRCSEGRYGKTDHAK
ncbi:hypothetical protein EZS27_034564 [termite gut metagenome]|uniref:Transposase IS4-like domain-containing protein n=1 Tax=termite gut metagenome TaxID=433724 RepID=A0A5J4Q1W6_9ZZZZ